MERDKLAQAPEVHKYHLRLEVLLECKARVAHLRRLPSGIVVSAVCRDNTEQEQAECEKRVDQALVTVNLACVAPTRDVWVCEKAKTGGKKSGHACPQEQRRLSTCLQARRVGNVWCHSAVLIFGCRRVCLGCALFTKLPEKYVAALSFFIVWDIGP